MVEEFNQEISVLSSALTVKYPKVIQDLRNLRKKIERKINLKTDYELTLIKVDKVQ
jgi:hypothetical protein